MSFDIQIYEFMLCATCMAEKQKEKKKVLNSPLWVTNCFGLNLSQTNQFFSFHSASKLHGNILKNNNAKSILRDSDFSCPGVQPEYHFFLKHL